VLIVHAPIFYASKARRRAKGAPARTWYVTRARTHPSIHPTSVDDERRRDDDTRKRRVLSLVVIHHRFRVRLVRLVRVVRLESHAFAARFGSSQRRDFISFGFRSGVSIQFLLNPRVREVCDSTYDDDDDDDDGVCESALGEIDNERNGIKPVTQHRGERESVNHQS